MSSELQVHPDTGTGSLVLNRDSMKAMYDMANMMASAAVTVPKHLANSPGDCLAVVMQAMQWGMNPFAVAQKTHIVNGSLGYEAQLVNAVVSASKAAGRFHYEYKGDGLALSCRVGAVIAGEDEITWGEWLSVSDVKVQNSPLWKTNPRQQLGYLQVKNWARAFTPGAILGVYTDDELADSPRVISDTVVHRDDAPKEIPEYPQDQYDANLDKWAELLAAKKKTADDLINMVQAKSGCRFTDAQRQVLFDCEEAANENA